MEQTIKAVFFDVDGTLLSHTLNDVPKSAREALKKLQDNGIKIIVATGRHMIEYRKLPVADIPFDGYLTLNGNLMLDENKRMYAGTHIDYGEMEVLARIFEADKIPSVFIGENTRYINYINDTVIRTQEETKGTVPDVGEWYGENIYQILAFIPNSYKEKLNVFLDQCEVTSWNDNGLDIIPKGGGKAAGIQKYLDKYGVKQEETMAFGDAENDIEMLKFVGIGVAMGNASDSVKEIADYVTADIDEDGIEKALKHFGLID